MLYCHLSLAALSTGRLTRVSGATKISSLPPDKLLQASRQGLLPGSGDLTGEATGFKVGSPRAQVENFVASRLCRLRRAYSVDRCMRAAESEEVEREPEGTGDGGEGGGGMERRRLGLRLLILGEKCSVHLAEARK